jgi:hypothetical protein
MNREPHLRTSLERWLSLACVAEVIIVDWSNQTPLWHLLAIDARIRVLRVVDEPRWVLSYAYNLGIMRASHDTIIKCDADCAPSAAIRDFEPDQSRFYAGHWQSGRAHGKSAINGQCIVTKAQFERVNGYSELMRAYGIDDEDLYRRLTAAGFRRGEIPPDLFEVIDHTDGERLANQRTAPPGNVVDWFMEQSPMFFEAQNFYIARAAPWGPRYPRAEYVAVETAPRAETLRRRRDREIDVPGQIARQARAFATRALVKRLFGMSGRETDRLTEAACRELIAQELMRRQSPPAAASLPRTRPMFTSE